MAGLRHNQPLRWTGPSLYDLASDRLRACANGTPEGQAPRLREGLRQALAPPN